MNRQNLKRPRVYFNVRGGFGTGRSCWRREGTTEEQSPLTRVLGRRLPCIRPTRQEVGPFRPEEREPRKTGRQTWCQTEKPMMWNQSGVVTLAVRWGPRQGSKQGLWLWTWWGPFGEYVMGKIITITATLNIIRCLLCFRSGDIYVYI